MNPKGSRYAPPAAPTWLWSASSMAPSYPVLQPLLLSLSWEGHGSCHDVHGGDPHAAPVHLQPEEQGHERGFRESAYHEIFIFSVRLRKSY